MNWNSLSFFGSALVLVVMFSAAYTFSLSLVAGRRGSYLKLEAARQASYGTVALVIFTTLILSYAFVSHDFRIRYVAEHSDRNMSLFYLFSALWGGQDGSILWWLFLLSLYIGACVKWMGNRYRELQPYVLATFMVVVFFFTILMGFAANPFAEVFGAEAADGKGLSPLLQNFYMIIHPPSLYVGFVGCTVPFAFAVAALVTGRLDNEWILASRKWMLFAWMFLSIGNVLGMVWAYEELGWGGYWAWDPVENAAFMPWLIASAYLHSIMIQERRGMFKVWNLILVSYTFFATILGTFMTRSGLIASVHSFAQSSIGSYFSGFMVFIVALAYTSVLYRLPELRDLPKDKLIRRGAVTAGWLVFLVCGPGLLFFILKLPYSLTVRVLLFSLVMGATVALALEIYARHKRLVRQDSSAEQKQIESFFSREFAFLLNNWALLGFQVFVLVASIFPLFSELVLHEKVSVAPPYYNAWVQPLGLFIYLLMGLGTLFGWSKTSAGSLKKAVFVPVSVALLVAIAHLSFGDFFGFPASVWSPAIYEGWLGSALRAFNAYCPLFSISVVAFNLTVISQEFYWFYLARMRNRKRRKEEKKTAEQAKGVESKTPLFLYYFCLLPGVIYTLFSLPHLARRRYGGYVVHLGLVVMLFGFTGLSWNISKEASLFPGQSLTVRDYSLTYIKPEMRVDAEKRVITTTIEVKKDNQFLGHITPGKYIYKKMPEAPTTEVRMLHRLRDDIYVVVGAVNPQTKLASFQVHINPLVLFVWLGCLILILGSSICLWPEFKEEESKVWRFSKGLAHVATSLMVGISVALMPTQGFAQAAPNLAGAPSMVNPPASLGSSSRNPDEGPVDKASGANLNAGSVMPLSHTGTVKIEGDTEKSLFGQLRCMCGACALELLSTCACGYADDARQELREKLKSGMTPEQIVAEYIKKYGREALAVPPNQGAFRLIYIGPLAAIFLAALFFFNYVRRFISAPDRRLTASGPGGLEGEGALVADSVRREQNRRIEEALEELDEA